jgi:hypothetical protein
LTTALEHGDAKTINAMEIARKALDVGLIQSTLTLKAFRKKGLFPKERAQK